MIEDIGVGESMEDAIMLLIALGSIGQLLVTGEVAGVTVSCLVTPGEAHAAPIFLLQEVSLGLVGELHEVRTVPHPGGGQGPTIGHEGVLAGLTGGTGGAPAILLLSLLASVIER